MAMRSFKTKDTNMYDVREFYKLMPPLTPAKFWFDVMRNSRFKVEIVADTCRVYRND